MKFTTCISGGEICKRLEFQRRHTSRATAASPLKRYLRLGDFDDFKFSNCVFLVVFFKKRPVVSRRKKRSTFDQVRVRQKKDSGLPRDCGLFFRRVHLIYIYISHTPQCTTSCEDRRIVLIAVKDRSITSRTIAQHIDSVTHHSVSAGTIRRRLQQSGLSARRPLLGLPLMQNHKLLRLQWCDERRMWAAEWNEVVFTDESRICLQHHDGRIQVWRHRGERMLNSCVMHRHTGPLLGIMVWGCIGYHSHTPLVRIAGTLNSQHYISEVLEPVVLPYLQGLVTVKFQQDNA
ncbi:transposable element Tcb1 transposase [Trichonephila clavipes]|nr:transposable element Tcb1 transposase [Trichonephila clavipes]